MLLLQVPLRNADLLQRSLFLIYPLLDRHLPSFRLLVAYHVIDIPGHPLLARPLPFTIRDGPEVRHAHDTSKGRVDSNISCADTR